METNQKTGPTVIFQPGSNPTVFKIDSFNVYGDFVAGQSATRLRQTAVATATARQAAPDPQAVAKALRTLAGVVPKSRRYKWGMGCLAMQRLGLLPRDISASAFARLVERHTGISAKTVRDEGAYYVYAPAMKAEVDELADVINGAMG